MYPFCLKSMLITYDNSLTFFSELHDAWNVQPSLNRRPSAQTPSLQDIGSVYTVIIIDACMLFSWAVKNGNNFSLHRCL
jgi:hypothetical protein